MTQDQLIVIKALSIANLRDKGDEWSAANSDEQSLYRLMQDLHYTEPQILYVLELTMKRVYM